MPKAELVDRPYLTADQLSALDAELGPEQAAFMWIGVVLGLRWAEVAGLVVADVDPLRGMLRVSGQLSRNGTRQVTKTRAGARMLSVPAWLVDMLAAVMASKGLTVVDAGELIFTSSEATPLHYSNWRRRMWVPAAERAGLAGLRFHDLRSMAATALIASGADVKTTQTRLGHANPQTTLALYRAGHRRTRTRRRPMRWAPSSGRGAPWTADRPRDVPCLCHGAPLRRGSSAVRSALTCGFVVGARGLEPPTSAV